MYTFNVKNYKENSNAKKSNFNRYILSYKCKHKTCFFAERVR